MSIDGVTETTESEARPDDAGAAPRTRTTSQLTTLSATYTTYRVAPGYRVNVRRSPSTSAPIVRVLPYDARIEIRCQCRGELIRGPYGTTDIWDLIAPGEYVSDAYVLTGSDGFVAPRCG